MQPCCDIHAHGAGARVSRVGVGMRDTTYVSAHHTWLPHWKFNLGHLVGAGVEHLKLSSMPMSHTAKIQARIFSPRPQQQNETGSICAAGGSCKAPGVTINHQATCTDPRGMQRRSARRDGLLCGKQHFL